MRAFADWNCKLLPMMHDLIANPSDAAQALSALKKLGISRFCMMPEFDCQQESLSLFLLNRDRALREIHKQMPENAFITSAATLLLTEGCHEVQGLRKLCIPQTNYLPIKLPLSLDVNWLAHEFNQFLYHLPFRLLLMNFDTYSLFYPSEVLDRLLNLPNVAYQFNYRALADPNMRIQLKRLLMRHAPILFGTSVNSVMKAYYYEFSHYIGVAKQHFTEFECDDLFFRKKIYQK